MPTVEFTGNYQDLSTDRGYQFKFYCEKCGNGYMSTFQASKLGMAASAAQVAGNLFGGLFGKAADTAYEIQRAVGGPLHDAALEEATTEIRPLFKQCTRCGQWVCGKVCFNEKAGLCERCAPDMDEEVAAAQAEAARLQALERAREVDWMKCRDLEEVTGISCKSCGAKVGSAKYCPECGVSTALARRQCVDCGTQAEGAGKFCPECGSKFA